MKKKAEFVQERLTQLKQNFNNPSKFWQTIHLINQKSIMFNFSTSEQWYEHFSGVFHTFNSLPDEKNGDDVMEDVEAGVFGEAISRDQVTASF